MADKDQPQQETHYAYSVIKREGKEDYWLNLGIVFPHKDGKGFSIFTNAWPHDGKLVCREITDDKDAENERTKQAVRQTNDRRRGR
jgi:hypothetical protein